ncbi:uncharacterized protein Dmoj_GI18093, isoform B [Drosophila mojavensis]|uniref:Uncharacterized protein, isoform B n=1 Tax=Drosophila mojavensis TaxID=7230 RepID=B4KGM3_DROMO|nr:uncharacterized protein Dmoj_GI18093, isoform B [Drosophila mojavensis]
MWAYKVYVVLMVLGLGVLIVEADEDRDIVNATLFVDECPHIQMEENAPKYRLLGVWYAYATTPLPFQHYQRRCASYNVRNSRTLRILTRSRTPDSELIAETNEYLMSRGFNIRILIWLRANAFCFEWYELKFETERQPMSYQAPFNMLGPLGR